MWWLIVKWALGLLAAAVVVGLFLAWKLSQANAVGGSDHDFGTKP